MKRAPELVRKLSSRFTIQSTLLKKQEVRELAPHQRDTYTQNAILRILERSPKGVTVSEVATITGFSRPTVSKHLDILVAIGEAYKAERSNLSVYHKNGKVVHWVETRSVTTPEKTYTFYVLDNNDGKFVYIQEKESDLFNSSKVKGGVTIGLKDISTIRRMLEELSVEVEKS